MVASVVYVIVFMIFMVGNFFENEGNEKMIGRFIFSIASLLYWCAYFGSDPSLAGFQLCSFCVALRAKKAISAVAEGIASKQPLKTT
jgi:hypothetical protein